MLPFNLFILTVLKQHVDCVKRCPANGEQHNDGDHHFNGSFLFSVEKKNINIWYVDFLQVKLKSYVYKNTYILPLFIPNFQRPVPCTAVQLPLFALGEWRHALVMQRQLKSSHFYDSNTAYCFQQRNHTACDSQASFLPYCTSPLISTKHNWFGK